MLHDRCPSVVIADASEDTGALRGGINGVCLRGVPSNRLFTENVFSCCCCGFHYLKMLIVRFFVVRKAFVGCSWCENVSPRNPKTTLLFSTFA